jgi:hypothetical protein
MHNSKSRLKIKKVKQTQGLLTYTLTVTPQHQKWKILVPSHTHAPGQKEKQN